jgi:hypothetical protein
VKRILVIILMTVSTLAFAGRPHGCNENANVNSAVACNQNPLPGKEFATVPSPGTFALVAMGLTGLIVSLKRRK